jgi:DNA-binding NarL/FixJ family response regulator
MRVVVAEDSVLLREGVARLLQDAGHEVVGQAGDADDLMRKVRAHKPDLAVVDVRMPPTQTDEGLRAAKEIRAELPGVGVLVLSGYVEPTYAQELLAENAEGLGYLLKDRVSDVTAFADAVERVGTGGSALDPEVVSVPSPRERSAGGAHPSRARGARPDGRGPLQRCDRRAARGHRPCHREARHLDLQQARPHGQ